MRAVLGREARHRRDLIRRRAPHDADIGKVALVERSEHGHRQYLRARLAELGVPPEKFVIDLAETGNTVSSTVPIALARAAASGRLKAGMKVLISGFGVGLSWGTAVIEWAE